MRRLVFVLTLLVTGCGGPPHPAADMDRARAALEVALEGWKRGEGADKLRTRAEPIDFLDEDQKLGFRLHSYEWVGPGHTDRELIRYTVKLSLTNRGKKVDRSTTYGVALKTPIAIARDPYF